MGLDVTLAEVMTIKRFADLLNCWILSLTLTQKSSGLVTASILSTVVFHEQNYFGISAVNKKFQVQPRVGSDSSASPPVERERDLTREI